MNWIVLAGPNQWLAPCNPSGTAFRGELTTLVSPPGCCKQDETYMPCSTGDTLLLCSSWCLKCSSKFRTPLPFWAYSTCAKSQSSEVIRQVRKPLAFCCNLVVFHIPLLFFWSWELQLKVSANLTWVTKAVSLSNGPTEIHPTANQTASPSPDRSVGSREDHSCEILCPDQ